MGGKTSKENPPPSPQKITVVGDGAVGKTSMIITYKDEFPEEYCPTVCDNITASVRVKNQPVDIVIWDTGTGCDYNRLRPLYYTGTDCFIICISLNFRSSISRVRSIYIPEIIHYSPDIPCILVGTKIDLRENEEEFEERHGHSLLTKNEGEMLAGEIHAAAYVECSALTRKNLSKVFETAAEVAITKEKWDVPRLKEKGMTVKRAKR